MSDSILSTEDNAAILAALQAVFDRVYDGREDVAVPAAQIVGWIRRLADDVEHSVERDCADPGGDLHVGDDLGLEFDAHELSVTLLRAFRTAVAGHVAVEREPWATAFLLRKAADRLPRMLVEV